MNTTLNLNEVLRYGYCGAALIAGIVVSGGYKYPSGTLLDTAGGAALVGASTLALGAILYSTYRAILYPLLGRLALYAILTPGKRPHPEPRHLSPFIITGKELERDRFRWRQRDETSKGKPKLDEWASQVHLLYTTGLAYPLGAALQNVVISGRGLLPIECPTEWNYDYKILIPSTTLLMAAYISDQRRRRIEEILFTEDQNRRTKMLEKRQAKQVLKDTAAATPKP